MCVLLGSLGRRAIASRLEVHCIMCGRLRNLSQPRMLYALPRLTIDRVQGKRTNAFHASSRPNLKLVNRAHTMFEILSMQCDKKKWRCHAHERNGIAICIEICCGFQDKLCMVLQACWVHTARTTDCKGDVR